jgi:hypothetical protein
MTNDGRLSWSISRASGVVVPRAGLHNSDGERSTEPVIRLLPGEYTLSIDGTGEATGPYMFRLSDLDAVLAITPHEALTGTLTPGNETDLVQFSASAGDRIYFDALQWTGSAGTQWRLIDPEDQVVFNTSLNQDMDTQTLPLSGTYVLALEGQIVGSAGDYTISLRPASASIEALTLGSTIAGAIATPGAQREYSFSLAARSLIYFDALTRDTCI